MGGDIYGDMHTGSKALRLQQLFVDPNFLETFTFPPITGDVTAALQETDAAVITESTAMKLFGQNGRHRPAFIPGCGPFGAKARQTAYHTRRSAGSAAAFFHPGSTY